MLPLTTVFHDFCILYTLIKFSAEAVSKHAIETVKSLQSLGIITIHIGELLSNMAISLTEICYVALCGEPDILF